MEKEKSNKTKEIIKTIATYLLIILAVILIRVFFVDPVRVDGSSMNTTLSDGEIMLLNKIVYKKNDIKRFDIVVVNQDDKYIIKRVIGLPGEVISYRDNELYIDGKKVEDPYPSTKTDDFTIEDVGHTKIPGDTYFVMGDNRSDSLDSRYPSVGVIRKENIVGRAKFVIWPFNKIGDVK